MELIAEQIEELEKIIIGLKGIQEDIVVLVEVKKDIQDIIDDMQDRIKDLQELYDELETIEYKAEKLERLREWESSRL